jgi:antitoxin component YwqK of YwqJK toxin-antitoxin module
MIKLLFAFSMLVFIGCSSESENTVNEIDPTIESPFKDITDGMFIEYHPNGKLKTKGLLKNGKRTGVWIAYHTNGNIYSENKYKTGVLNGKTAAYYPNGNVQYVGLYINNKKDDSWFFYGEDGALDKEILFIGGEKIKTTP